MNTRLNPDCPRCQLKMVEAVHELRAESSLPVGGPAPPRVQVPVWRCEKCGIQRPRLDSSD
jgi:hypothetical protein